MKVFEKDFAATPILVCLTQADRLYEEKCDDDMFPECPESKISTLKSHFQSELEVMAIVSYFVYCFFTDNNWPH